MGNQVHDVNVWKGPEPGDAYIEGEQNSLPTTLRINSAFSENGHAVFGRLVGTDFKGNWEQEPVEGDATLFINKAKMTLDQNPASGVTETAGTRIKATATRTNEEGDENVAITCDGQRISLTVDRKPGGHIELRGKSGGENFRLQMTRRGKDGDLMCKGSLPESLSLLPVMWELYGDDSKEPPARPLSMGAVASLSAFYATQAL
ncbi:MAG: hypothetical protein KIS61_04905 [Candidatus Eremiobacteraeota bacterium]|nr:hypothetical protein [Candidatus Eremiobacteraeota bacterium]